MLGYFIVIAILAYLFVHMTMSILNWGVPEVIEQPKQSSDSAMLSEIHEQNEYYSPEGDE